MIKRAYSGAHKHNAAGIRTSGRRAAGALSGPGALWASRDAHTAWPADLSGLPCELAAAVVTPIQGDESGANINI